jgi:hypothetical protein
MEFAADLDVDLAERVCSAGLAVPDGNGPALGEGGLAVWIDLGRPGNPDIQPQKNVRATVPDAGKLANTLDDWWAGHAENDRQPHMQVKLPGRDEYVDYVRPEIKRAFLDRTLFGDSPSEGRA